MRKGHYRYQMFDEVKRKEWALPLKKVFDEWKILLDSGGIEPWEFIAYYLLIFVFLKSPKEKLKRDPNKECNGIKYEILKTSVYSAFRGVLSEKHLMNWEYCLTWPQSEMKNLRSIPEKVLWSLRNWRLQRIDLILVHHIPTPHELLSLQIQGKRFVSALIQEHEIEALVEEGRDVCSFCLHDLLHASHFFGDVKFIYAQRYLSYFFLQVLDQSEFANWLKLDQQFSNEFLYVAADMNAHPVYIFYSFYSKFIEFFKRKQGYSSNDTLSCSDEILWIEFWSKFLEKLNLNKNTFEVFISIGKDKAQNAIILEKTLLSLGQVFS